MDAAHPWRYTIVKQEMSNYWRLTISPIQHPRSVLAFRNRVRFAVESGAALLPTGQESTEYGNLIRLQRKGFTRSTTCGRLSLNVTPTHAPVKYHNHAIVQCTPLTNGFWNAHRDLSLDVITDNADIIIVSWHRTGF